MFVKLWTYDMSIPLTIEIDKNYIDTSTDPKKEYYRIILLLMFLSNETDVLRRLLPNTSGFFQGRCARCEMSLSRH